MKTANINELKSNHETRNDNIYDTIALKCMRLIFRSLSMNACKMCARACVIIFSTSFSFAVDSFVLDAIKIVCPGCARARACAKWRRMAREHCHKQQHCRHSFRWVIEFIQFIDRYRNSRWYFVTPFIFVWHDSGYIEPTFFILSAHLLLLLPPIWRSM